MVTYVFVFRFPKRSASWSSPAKNFDKKHCNCIKQLLVANVRNITLKNLNVFPGIFCYNVLLFALIIKAVLS